MQKRFRRNGAWGWECILYVHVVWQSRDISFLSEQGQSFISLECTLKMFIPTRPKWLNFVTIDLVRLVGKEIIASSKLSLSRCWRISLLRPVLYSCHCHSCHFDTLPVPYPVSLLQIPCSKLPTCVDVCFFFLFILQSRSPGVPLEGNSTSHCLFFFLSDQIEMKFFRKYMDS